MILTSTELQQYRDLVGLQMAYAQIGDSHKVVHLQNALMGMIRIFAERRITEKTGANCKLTWSDVATGQYMKLCAEGMKAADEGFGVWKKKQLEIEAWVSTYIEQGVLQASISEINVNQKK